MRRRIFALLLMLALGTTACARSGTHHAGAPMDQGGGTPARPAGRSVAVDMKDFSFSPAQLSVKRGESVTFRFHNVGTQLHEAVIGDQAAQSAEEQAMAQGSMGHMGANAVEVKPGATADLTYTFDKTGELLIGCHEPGHYPAGMRATVAISA
jgi:uncharacterized cupredoxin-like copper-binding protein